MDDEKPIYGFKTGKGSLYIIDKNGMTVRYKRAANVEKGEPQWYPPHHILFSPAVTKRSDLYISDNEASETVRAKTYVLGGIHPRYDAYVKFSPLSSETVSTAGIPSDTQLAIQVIDSHDPEISIQTLPAYALPVKGVHVAEYVHINGRTMTHVGNKVTEIFHDRQSLIDAAAEYGISRDLLIEKGAMLTGEAPKPRSQTPSIDWHHPDEVPAPLVTDQGTISKKTHAYDEFGRSQAPAVVGSNIVKTLKAATMGRINLDWRYSPAQNWRDNAKVTLRLEQSQADQLSEIMNSLKIRSSVKPMAVGAELAIRVCDVKSITLSTGSDGADGRGVGLFERAFHAYGIMGAKARGEEYSVPDNPSPTAAMNTAFKNSALGTKLDSFDRWQFVPAKDGDTETSVGTFQRQLRKNDPAEKIVSALQNAGVRAQVRMIAMGDVSGVSLQRPGIIIHRDRGNFGGTNNLEQRVTDALNKAATAANPLNTMTPAPRRTI